MQLAETMMARGFASGEAQADSRPQWLLLAGLVGLVTGWLARLVWRMELLGIVLLLFAAAALAGGLWLAGRQHPHTVYRPEEWHARDWFVVAGALVAVIAYLAPLPWVERASLFYYPYPSLAWPAFDVRIALATLGLGLPALLRYLP